MKSTEKLELKQMEELLWAGIAEAGNIPEQLAEIANVLGSRADDLGYWMDPNLANYLFLLDRLFGYAKEHLETEGYHRFLKSLIICADWLW